VTLLEVEGEALVVFVALAVPVPVLDFTAVPVCMAVVTGVPVQMAVPVPTEAVLVRVADADRVASPVLGAVGLDRRLVSVGYQVGPELGEVLGDLVAVLDRVDELLGTMPASVKMRFSVMPPPPLRPCIKNPDNIRTLNKFISPYTMVRKCVAYTRTS
jgi:hypothetical protein